MEDFNQILGNGGIAYQFPLGSLPIEVIVENMQVSQFCKGDGGICDRVLPFCHRIGDPCHIAAQVVRDGFIVKSFCQDNAIFQLGSAV